jgi:hypothetical protein
MNKLPIPKWSTVSNKLSYDFRGTFLGLGGLRNRNILLKESMVQIPWGIFLTDFRQCDYARIIISYSAFNFTTSSLLCVPLLLCVLCRLLTQIRSHGCDTRSTTLRRCTSHSCIRVCVCLFVFMHVCTLSVTVYVPFAMSAIPHTHVPHGR